MNPKIIISIVASAVMSLFMGFKIGKRAKKTNLDYIDGFEAGARTCEKEWRDGLKTGRIQIDRKENPYKAI